MVRSGEAHDAPGAAEADLSGPWRPSGILTWTTDFGLVDAYVGTMHGVVLGRLPEARLIDLTHGVPAQDVAAGALQLRHAWPYFPAGSVHVAVVDPGVGTERAVLVGWQDGHAFVAPDNGLLAGALDPARAVVHRVDPGLYGLDERSSTFHGRDVFAPLAAALAGGEDPRGLGSPQPGWDRGAPARRTSHEFDKGGATEARIVLIDRFGNAITDLEPGPLGPHLTDYSVQVMGRTIPVVDTYASVGPGAPLALVDSWGHLEIAIRDGSAAQSLGLAPGTTVTLRNPS